MPSSSNLRDEHIGRQLNLDIEVTLFTTVKFLFSSDHWSRLVCLYLEQFTEVSYERMNKNGMRGGGGGRGEGDSLMAHTETLKIFLSLEFETF